MAADSHPHQRPCSVHHNEKFARQPIGAIRKSLFVSKTISSIEEIVALTNLYNGELGRLSKIRKLLRPLRKLSLALGSRFRS